MAGRARRWTPVQRQSECIVSRTLTNRTPGLPFKSSRSAGWVSTMDVEEWLEGLGLAQYAAAFAENDIDFGSLGKLADADLKELGISSLGHRKRLLAAIAERGLTAAPSPRHADGSPGGGRRQVTILFADLCGLTAI